MADVEYLDARRLTGPNLLWERPGSILDVRCSPDEVPRVVEVWTAVVRDLLSAVGWSDESLCTRTLRGGVSLAFSAPIDALYAATEINEVAWAAIEADMDSGPAPDLSEAAARIREEIATEENPALLDLSAAAERAGVAFLWDDDDVSVGMGRGSQSWPFRELPAPDAISWQDLHDVPVGIVTGTNGKTTTVRLATHIARVAGESVGVSCTDWIAVNDTVIDRGDWSGPGGARNVLRQPDVSLAVLEAARGGLLRRGLGVDAADAALITNIAEDHLGDFGSQTLEELLDIKWVVSHAVREHGRLVLNADDTRLAAKADGYGGEIVWFSLNADSAVVRDHVSGGGTAFVLDDGVLTKRCGSDVDALCDQSDIPIALEGAARHNVANALAAAALTEGLGVSLKHIRRGLMTMTPGDNPGRCNLYDVGEVKLLVDFAHNPAAMQSLFDMARALPAKRRLLAFGQAGDRPNESIQELARSAHAIGLDAVVVSELAEYHRGREHGEVFGVIRDELMRCGVAAGDIHHFDDELASLNFGLQWAEPGDLLILLDLGRDAAVADRIKEVATG